MRIFLSQRAAAAVALSILFIAAACGSTASDSVSTGSADSGATDSEAMAMDDGSGHEHEHDHGAGLEVSADLPVPEVSVAIVNDPKSGQNLTVSLANFDVTPELASTGPLEGGGHMHLYVDGEREGRFYNEAIHLELEPGDHIVEVELSANNHAAWTVEGEPIRAEASITVPEPEGHEHAHGGGDTAEIGWSPVPNVDLEVVKDPKSGWNVHAAVENFELSAANASTANVDGQGHMHLYVNGNKITRLYGEWHLLTDLPAGENTVTVELNGNDHTPLISNGTPVGATVMVTVDDNDGAMAMEEMDHSTMDHSEMDGSMAMEEGAIVLGLLNGEVVSDRDRYEVAKGDTVVMLVDADIVEEVHVHGYDLHLPVGPDGTARLEFEATISGVFEVEFEESGMFLAELLVR